MSDENEKSIEEQITDARNKLIEIHATLSMYLKMDIPDHKRAEVSYLQDRLEFRTKHYELLLLKEKIDIYGKAVKLLRP